MCEKERGEQMNLKQSLLLLMNIIGLSICSYLFLLLLKCCGDQMHSSGWMSEMQMKSQLRRAKPRLV